MEAIKLQDMPSWPSNSVHIISVSGGKDSTATILRAIEAGISFRCVFADTGNEHDITYEYLGYLENRLGIRIERVKADFTQAIWDRRLFIAQDKRKGVNKSGRPLRWPLRDKKRAIKALRPSGNPFLDMCLWKGLFPSRKRQFCTEFLKRVPITDEIHLPMVQAGKTVISWQGVRRDESARRSNYEPLEVFGTDLWCWRPVLDQTALDVFAIMRRHGVKPNPLYNMGFSRVGCMPCINSGKEEIYLMSRRFPEVIDRIRSWEEQVRETSRQQESTFFHQDTTSSQYVGRMLYVDDVVQWSKTKRGGKQFDMLKTLPLPACSNHYGLCE